MNKLYALFLCWLTVTTATAQFTLVREFGPDPVGGFEVLDGITVFRAEGNLWRSDGTAAGTFRLTASSTWDVSSSLTRCRVGNVIFWIDNSQRLWKTDGTVAGTIMVKELLGGSVRGPLVNVNGLLLFGVNTAATGIEIWRSDGTDAGTFLVTDLIPGSGDGYAYSSQQSSVLDGYFYFWGPSAPTGVPNIGDRGALYRTDGTAAGTTRVGNGGFEPFGMNVINGRLVYQAYYPIPYTCQGANLAYQRVLMRIENGTAAVLKLPANVSPGAGCDPAPIGNTFLNSDKFVRSANYLYFRGQEEVVGGQSTYNLWRTDGTGGGTIQLTNFAAGSNEGLASNGTTFTDHFGNSDFNFTDVAYFPLYTAAAGAELWRSDGTVAGTYLLKDIYPGAGGSGQGTGSGAPNNSNTGPTDPRTVNGITYFFASDDINGIEPWKTDGTAAGTQLVQDLKAGAAGQGELRFLNDHFNNTSTGVTYFMVGVSPTNGARSGLFALNADGSALPVRLLYFSGGVINQRTQLAWATASETANEGFSILKSRDALGWEPVGFVAGKGQSTQRQTYTFTDADVRPGQVWYYKLRQRDHNGKTEESKVIAVSIEAGAGRSLPYPNPSPDGSFRLTAQAATGQTVRLFTLSGQELAIQTQLTADDMLVTPRQPLGTGVYVIKLTSEAGAARAMTLMVER